MNNYDYYGKNLLDQEKNTQEHIDNVSRCNDMRGSNSMAEANRILDKENAVREMKNTILKPPRAEFR